MYKKIAFYFMMSFVVSMLVITAIIISCATFTDTGIRGYLAAKDEIANIAEQYEVVYQSASQVAKDKWKKEIDPLFLDIEKIMMEWEALLKLGQNTASTQQKYILIKKAILTYLVEIKKG